MKKRDRKSKRERLMPVLPSLFTTAGLFFGLLSIFVTIQALVLRTAAVATPEEVETRFWWAAAFIIISALFDLIDGGIARFLKLETRFGFSYDSLSDVISFGVAPGVLVYCWALMATGKLGLMSVLIFIVCAALRLARFNIQSGASEKYNFTGLPSPAAAGLMVTPVMLLTRFAYPPSDITTWYFLLLAPLLGLLMVSEVPYSKGQRFLFRRSFNGLVISAIVIAAAIAEPEIVLSCMMYFYGITGMVLCAYRGLKERPAVEKKKAASDEDPPERLPGEL